MSASWRPAMTARDSIGRNISLLNDDSSSNKKVTYRPVVYSVPKDGNQPMRSNSYVSEASSPSTPDLLRSDSYDSQTTNDPVSPITPSSAYEFGKQASYGSGSAYPDPSQYDQRSDRHSMFSSYPAKRHSSGSAARSPFVERNSYEEERTSERSGSAKRYPCRFKDSHGCDKTFTTSGHASRHSKIHTAEKAVHCSFPGCQKKFTRADNMKQHLETHYKERSRASTSSQKSSTKLTMPAGVRKPTGPSGRVSPPATRADLRSDSFDSTASYAHPTHERYSSHYSPVASPVSSYGALDMATFCQGLPSQAPQVSRPTQPLCGLDTLAVIACQDRL